MSSVLQACIEETDNLDQELIDILLNPLIPSNKIENPAAYKLVSTVLRKTTNNIQIPISNFVNHVLVGSGNNGDIDTDLTEHIYSLIYELHKISPEVLLRMLPNICIQLQSEEEDIRLKAVKLLGRLFSSRYADYGAEFNRNFKDFLNRFVDISPLVRLEMIECAAIIMKNKPNLISLVEGNKFFNIIFFINYLF
jgi:sister-chromatid-cohesion protein PDS5